MTHARTLRQQMMGPEDFGCVTFRKGGWAVRLGGRPPRGAGVEPHVLVRGRGRSSRHSFAPAGRERLLPGELNCELPNASKAGSGGGAALSIGVAIATGGGVGALADVDARVLASRRLLGHSLRLIRVWLLRSARSVCSSPLG